MTSTNNTVNEISPLEHQSKYISEQPIDRHLIEITDEKETVFMNAGIDSTCGKKRSAITHTLTDEPTNSSTLNHPADLNSNGEQSTPVYESDIHTTENCSQCGK